MSTPPPTLLADRFRFLRPTAGGWVYEDQQTGAPVHVRRVALREASGAREIGQLEREAEVLRTLKHPAFPPFVACCRADSGASSALYLVTDWCDGDTLFEEATERSYDEADVIAILVELLRALAYLHALRPPLILRDIRPEAIRRSRIDGRLRFTSLDGLTQAIPKPRLGAAHWVGVHGYVAPEVHGGRALPTSDLYALGATALWLLTRHEPSELLESGVDWSEDFIISPSLVALLRDLLQPNPDSRPQDARTVANRLLAARGDGTPVQPQALVRTSETTARARPAPSAYAEPPPIPRPAARGLVGRHLPFALFKLLFGGIFGGIWLALGLASLVSVLLDLGVASALTGMLLGGALGLAGAGVFAWGMSDRSRLNQLWTAGQVAPGHIVWIREQRKIRINRRYPLEVEYRFESAGVQHTAKTLTLDPRARGLVPGVTVAIIHDPNDPSQSLVFLG